jgi:hypothetical protein
MIRVVFEPNLPDEQECIPAMFRMPYGVTVASPPRKGELIEFPGINSAYRVSEVKWSFDRAGTAGVIVTVEV